jgi:hypothetical protein
VSFVLLSADSALEQTVGDALSGLQRQVTRDPSCGSLKVR